MCFVCKNCAQKLKVVYQYTLTSYLLWGKSEHFTHSSASLINEKYVIFPILFYVCI